MTHFAERKKQRKCKKYANILYKEWKINVSETPSKNLMFCNAGLLTGLCEVNMVAFFSRFGQIENVCLVPGKSYSFLSFSKVESAICCYSHVVDKIEGNNISGPLHMLFVECLPKINNLCSNYEIIPPGLIIVEDFVSESEESLLSKCVEISDINHDEVMKHRSVKHYGFKFDYNTNNVNKNEPLSEKLPKEFDFLRNRFSERNLSNVIEWIPDQLTVNSYIPGQGIPPHVDTHSAFEDPILSLSLMADVVMEFEKCDKMKKASVPLPRRSLLIMSGEARYYWTHGITPRKSDAYKDSNGWNVKARGHRISCTFRKIRNGDCNCNFPSVCDSFIKNNCKTPTGECARQIENDYVHKVYDTISNHFSLTRYSPWPKVRDFVQSLSPGSVLVDIGCGNGKYFNLNENIFHFGGDTCAQLTMICSKQGEVLRFNCLSLPFRDNIADAAICIAVLHHLSNELRRENAVKEIFRILRPNGRALIYVWAMEQKASNYVSKKLIEDDNFTENNSNNEAIPSSKFAFVNDTDILPIHENRTEFQHNDLLVPWNIRLKDTEESCHLRFYHVFKEKELDELCLQIGAEVSHSYFDDGNWCVEIRKPQR